MENCRSICPDSGCCVYGACHTDMVSADVVVEFCGLDQEYLEALNEVRRPEVSKR